MIPDLQASRSKPVASINPPRRNITETGRKHKPTKKVKWKPPAHVKPGWIYIWCSEPVAHFQARIGPEPWIPTDGFGGWEVVDRPHQVGMTVETTTPPYQYTGSVLFDGWHGRHSVEDDIKQLMIIAHGDDDNNPGIFSIRGIPDLPSHHWLIEDLEFDPDSVIRHPSNMERLRQKVTITMREYVSPHYVRVAKNATKKSKGNYTLKVTKDGDTPHKIAVREKVRIKDIIQLNHGNKVFKPPITKANQRLKKGLKIRIPVSDNKAHKDKSSRSRSHG